MNVSDQNNFPLKYTEQYLYKKYILPTNWGAYVLNVCIVISFYDFTI